MKTVVGGQHLCAEKVYDERLNTPQLYFSDIVGKRVLDVGCGAGRLGEFLQRQGNICYGITVSEPEGRIAKTRMQDVIVGDIERMETLPFSEGFFDVIIFADVLEHLQNPKRVLELVKPYLKSGGSIIASIPNVANIVVRMNLLRGQFNYEPFGIMDETHLRFYTLNTAKQLLISAGYYVYDVKVTHWNWQLPWLIRKPFAFCEWEIRQKMARWRPELFATQFAFYATRVEVGGADA